jgi:hypothetical protein
VLAGVVHGVMIGTDRRDRLGFGQKGGRWPESEPLWSLARTANEPDSQIRRWSRHRTGKGT